jgi:uncharacterized protein YdaU (DUF1376 family)
MLPEQEGAYFRLLCYQWNSENQTIPDSDEDLAMLSRLNGRWATLGAKVRACFDRVDGGGLRNERLWHEYTRIMGLRERQSAGGKKAMGNRWNQPQDSTKQPISDLQDTYNREQRTENRESGVGNRETEGKEDAPLPPSLEPPSVGSRKPYGEFGGVKLTDEEHAKLTTKHGAARLAKGIAVLDDYMRSKGKRYKDHYATLKETSWVWQRVDQSDDGKKIATGSKLVNTWHDPKPDLTMRKAF